MDAERARAFLLTLPDVVETLQWGDNLVFWVGDKSVGGKMFAVVNLSNDGLFADAHGVISFAAGPERFAELTELEAFYPAPYLARAHWVATRDWSCLRSAEWHDQLRHAREIVFEKLPKRARHALSGAEPKKSSKKAARRVAR